MVVLSITDVANLYIRNGLPLEEGLSSFTLFSTTTTLETITCISLKQSPRPPSPRFLVFDRNFTGSKAKPTSPMLSAGISLPRFELCFAFLSRYWARRTQRPRAREKRSLSCKPPMSQKVGRRLPLRDCLCPLGPSCRLRKRRKLREPHDPTGEVSRKESSSSQAQQRRASTTLRQTPMFLLRKQQTFREELPPFAPWPEEGGSPPIPEAREGHGTGFTSQGWD